MISTSKIERIGKLNPIFNYLTNPILKLIEWYRLSLFNLPKHDRNEWNRRIKDVLECPDILEIKCEPNTGRLVDGYLTMHNGIKIKSTSYYGYPIMKMLKESKGIHEPQEEKVFAEVLKHVPEKATMLELGSYWAFYSMWFHKEVNAPTCYMIEPTDIGLNSGKRNFEINNMKGNFYKAFISNKSFINEEEEKFISVDDFVLENKISFIDVLHSDIQGYEVEMLEGSKNIFSEKKVGYVFISTHSNQLHYECLRMLEEYNFKIISSADLDDTYSLDGLIVGRAPYYPGIDKVEISLKSNHRSKSELAS